MLYTDLMSLLMAANQMPVGDLEALEKIERLVLICVEKGEDALIRAQLEPPT